jgi:hypothetical protein
MLLFWLVSTCTGIITSTQNTKPPDTLTKTIPTFTPILTNETRRKPHHINGRGYQV